MSIVLVSGLRCTGIRDTDITYTYIVCIDIDIDIKQVFIFVTFVTYIDKKVLYHQFIMIGLSLKFCKYRASSGLFETQLYINICLFMIEQL